MSEHMEAPKNAIKLGNKYFVAKKELKDIMDKISMRPYGIGMYVGSTKRGFTPSLAYVEELSKLSKNIAIVNAKAEWMYLCGKDAFSANTKGKMTGEVFVNNEYGENVGFGKWLKKNVKNVFHKGMYLKD